VREDEKRKTYYLSSPLLNFGPTGCFPSKWASKTSIQYSTWAFVHISSVLCGTGVGGAGVDAVEEDVVRGGVGSSILCLGEKWFRRVNVTEWIDGDSRLKRVRLDKG